MLCRRGGRCSPGDGNGPATPTWRPAGAALAARQAPVADAGLLWSQRLVETSGPLLAKVGGEVLPDGST